jgi:hypothetical protein
VSSRAGLVAKTKNNPFSRHLVAVVRPFIQDLVATPRPTIDQFLPLHATGSCIHSAISRSPPTLLGLRPIPPCRAALCHAMPCCATLCHTEPCCTMLADLSDVCELSICDRCGIAALPLGCLDLLTDTRGRTQRGEMHHHGRQRT